MRSVVQCRSVRAVVLLLALGVGGVAGAPVMGLPPRSEVSIAGGDDDSDGDSGGGDGDDRPFGPDPMPAASTSDDLVPDCSDRVLARAH